MNKNDEFNFIKKGVFFKPARPKIISKAKTPQTREKYLYFLSQTES